MMLDMRALVEHGSGGYPLAEAPEDAYTWLLMDEAAKHPGQTVCSQLRAWHRR